MKSSGPVATPASGATAPGWSLGRDVQPAEAGASAPGREWLKVRIPAGVEDGTVLRVRGRGLGGMPGDRAGDLYLVVRMVSDPDFLRCGPDLWHRESISVADALLGVHRDIICLGQTIRLDVPPGTQPGTVLRLANRGLPRLRASGAGDRGERGDLHVVVDVVVPTTPSSTERDLDEQLRYPVPVPALVLAPEAPSPSDPPAA